MKLRALMPHQYANRQLKRGDIYTPESDNHSRLLVLFGRATICDDEEEKAQEKVSFTPERVELSPSFVPELHSQPDAEVQVETKKTRRRRRRKSKENTSE